MGQWALLWALMGDPAAVEAASGSQVEDLVALAGVEVPAAVAPRLSDLAAAFREATGKPLVVTNGTRRPAVQAALMLRNLERGDNIVRIYGNKPAARAVAATYAKTRKRGRRAALAALTTLIQKQVADGSYISGHLREGAVDVRCNGLDRRERATLKALARARKIGVYDESRTATPHFHLNFPR